MSIVLADPERFLRVRRHSTHTKSMGEFVLSPLGPGATDHVGVGPLGESHDCAGY